MKLVLRFFNRIKQTQNAFILQFFVYFFYNSLSCILFFN